MCTLVMLRRPDHRWPLVIGANRDEMADRPWEAPARHWPDREEVVAGLDVLAGGSWMGVNDYGVFAGILNRMNTLGPLEGKRSRGELVLEALDHSDAIAAARALLDLDGTAYRPFNLVVADNRDAFWLRATGQPRLEITPIGEGVHMLTAMDMDDPLSPRVRAYLPRFKDAQAPDPTAGDWEEWKKLLAHTGGNGSEDEEAAAMSFTRSSGFGTVSSALIALPQPDLSQTPPIWLFAPGRPDRTAFAPISF